MKKLLEKIEFLSHWPSPLKTKRLFIIVLVLAIFFNIITGVELSNSKYPDTGYVGPYPSWWFTFSGQELKSHYSVLLEQGTMDTFIKVQYLDFGLMLFTGLALFLLAVIVARAHKTSVFWRRFGFLTAIILALSPIMDVFENIILLIMLSNPLGFPNWMAIAYSGFATLKVSFVSVGLIFLLIISIALAVSKIKRYFAK